MIHLLLFQLVGAALVAAPPPVNETSTAAEGAPQATGKIALYDRSSPVGRGCTAFFSEETRTPGATWQTLPRTSPAISVDFLGIRDDTDFNVGDVPLGGLIASVSPGSPDVSGNTRAIVRARILANGELLCAGEREARTRGQFNLSARFEGVSPGSVVLTAQISVEGWAEGPSGVSVHTELVELDPVTITVQEPYFVSIRVFPEDARISHGGEIDVFMRASVETQSGATVLKSTTIAGLPQRVGHRLGFNNYVTGGEEDDENFIHSVTVEHDVCAYAPPHGRLERIEIPDARYAFEVPLRSQSEPYVQTGEFPIVHLRTRTTASRLCRRRDLLPGRLRLCR